VITTEKKRNDGRIHNYPHKKDDSCVSAYMQHQNIKAIYNTCKFNLLPVLNNNIFLIHVTILI